MIHKTTRSILSVLLAALLLVTSVPLTPAFARDGGVSLQSESGEGRVLTKDDLDTYLIYTAENLKEFAVIVNGTDSIPADSDADARLMNDIDLSSVCGPALDDGSPVSWTPIGNSINQYSGNFNGDGHTISGLYIDSNSANYQGLFGYVSGNVSTGGTVKDLSVSGTVSGNNFVGGVVGVNSGSVINCTNTGSVKGSGNRVGGVVGYNGGNVEECDFTGSVSGTDDYVGGVVGQNSGSVTNSYNTGSVSGDAYVGGAVGHNSGTVKNCYNTGSVTNSGSSVGGVVGYNISSVTNCYNTGEVSGNNYVGGVVGYNISSVTNCYNTGTVTGSYVGGVVGDNRGRVENCYNTGTVTGTDDYVGGVVGYNSHSGTVTGCYFLSSTAASGIGNGGSEPDATPVDDLNALCGKFENVEGWEKSENLNRPVLISNHEDDGTQQHPYRISTATQLENFRDLVNGANNQTADPDAHAKLMNNIDLSSVCSADKGSWNPIGTSSKPYTGTFDGNGHKIENLYINTTDSRADNQGLFGYVGSSGKVQNLSVSGSVSVSHGENVGGIVGYNSSGTVTNCAFSGSVDGIFSGSYVGGIVGYNSSGTVTNCAFSGSVSVSVSGNYVGGVVGYNDGDRVTNCYNTGSVKGSGNSVGGVVGYNQSGSSVTTCYNTGTVTGSYYVGGVVGDNRGTVKNCYYQIDKGATVGSDGTTADDTTTVAKTAAEFQSGEVAYLLQKEQPAESGQVWGQTLGGEEDSLPTLVALNPGAAQPVYKVTFKYGYDSAPADEISYTNGSVKFLAFERKGYTFAGWTPTDTTISQDTTFTAQWTANTYTVTLHTNDGTIAEGQNISSYTYGIGATLPTSVTREGYTFAGWYEKEDLTGDPVTEIGKDAIGDKAYWAKWEEVENPEPDPTPTPTPDPTPSGPSTGDSTGWDDIRDELENAEKGEQITIDMGDETKVPAEIFETLAGQDITLEIALEGGVTWSVNGTDIPADANLDDLDLGVEMDSDGIPVDVVNSITGERDTVQMTLAHDGAFGFTMTLTAPLGEENAGYWANLYHYDEDAEALNFEAAAKIDEDGSVTIPFSHASQYAIVIDTHSHAAVDVSDLFIDIAPDAWYKDAIQYAYDNGLMTGVSATEFAPEQTTTRAMIVSILARLEGVTTAEAAGFADVDDNDWYATAVNWAANVGVVNGYEDNTFRPNTAITREQLAAILMNYAAYKGYDVSARADLSHYSDADSISSWANDVLLWAVAEGLLTGVTDDTIAPQAHATRAQVAAILQRFLSE